MATLVHRFRGSPAISTTPTQQEHEESLIDSLDPTNTHQNEEKESATTAEIDERVERLIQSVSAIVGTFGADVVMETFTRALVLQTPQQTHSSQFFHSPSPSEEQLRRPTYRMHTIRALMPA